MSAASRTVLDDGSVVETGVVVEFRGRFWGEQYADGHSTLVAWGDIKRATIGDPQYLRQPEDATYRGSPWVAELRKGRLLRVRRITTYEVIAEEPQG